SKAADLFADRLAAGIGQRDLIRVSELWDEAPIIGAALSVKPEPESPLRKTAQYLAPTKAAASPKGAYDIYPAFSIASGQIHAGAAQLADWIAGQPQVVIEGYTGVFWDRF